MPFRQIPEIGGQGKPITDDESEKIAQEARWRSMIRKSEDVPPVPEEFRKEKILPGTQWKPPVKFEDPPIA